MMTAGAAALAIAAPAAAVPTTVTVTGNVMSGFDPAGTFGAAGTSLIGRAFSAIFTIDAKPGSTSNETALSSYLAGRGAASPVGATLTIGSSTYRFAGSAGGSAQVTDAAGKGGTDGAFYMVDDTDLSLAPPVDTVFYLGVDTLRNVLTRAADGSYAASGLSLADNAKGHVRIANRDATTGLYGATTYADLAVTSIRAQVASAVPEPGTWAMMVAGFAMAGVALRRRRVEARARLA